MVVIGFYRKLDSYDPLSKTVTIALDEAVLIIKPHSASSQGKFDFLESYPHHSSRFTAATQTTSRHKVMCVSTQY